MLSSEEKIGIFVANVILGQLPLVVPKLIYSYKLTEPWVMVSDNFLDMITFFMALAQLGFYLVWKCSPGAMVLGYRVVGWNGKRLNAMQLAIRSSPYVLFVGLIIILPRDLSQMNPLGLLTMIYISMLLYFVGSAACSLVFKYSIPDYLSKSHHVIG